MRTPLGIPVGAVARATFARHWRVYLMEAAGLAAFMIAASILTTLLEYPGSPVHRAVGAKHVRLAVLGLGMGVVIALIVYSPWGKRSGAHINPAVTWAFFRLGRIGGWDATFYTAAQFGGAVAAVQLMRLVLGAPYRHPAVDHVVTKPGPRGPLVAFGAEFGISFVLMLAVLVAVTSKRMERLAGLVTGVLITLYIAIETPLSGMSLNPARSFGSAVAARHWDGLWLYFAAPVMAMLLAAELYVRLGRRTRVRAAASYPVALPDEVAAGALRAGTAAQTTERVAPSSSAAP